MDTLWNNPAGRTALLDTQDLMDGLLSCLSDVDESCAEAIPLAVKLATPLCLVNQTDDASARQ